MDSFLEESRLFAEPIPKMMKKNKKTNRDVAMNKFVIPNFPKQQKPCLYII